MRRFLVILSLVISILFLIYSSLMYFGIFRYFSMHMGNIQEYYKKYEKVPKLNNERIIVSFSLKKEDDVKKLKPFLNSILNQSVRVNEIAVNGPYGLKLDDELKKIVSFYGQSKDYGECSCIIPTVLREPDTNTKIIVVNPHTIYDENFIVNMVDFSNENPKDMIECGSAYLIKPGFFTDKFTENKEKLNPLELCTKFVNKKVLERGNDYRRL